MTDVDSPHQDSSKADLYSILRRRKRSVESFIRENGVYDEKTLKAFIENKEQEFLLSDIFLEECYKITWKEATTSDILRKEEEKVVEPVVKTPTKRKQGKKQREIKSTNKTNGKDGS